MLMALRDLRVKTAVLADAAAEMQGAADAIPTAPESVSPAGADALSAAIAAHVTRVVGPLIAGRPKVIEEASAYAQAVGSAVRAYTGTDEQGGAAIDRSMQGIRASG